MLKEWLRMFCHFIEQDHPLDMDKCLGVCLKCGLKIKDNITHDRFLG
jgi:hypothetical protein